MSDNFNPQSLGTIFSFQESGILNALNPQDTFTWRVPSPSDMAVADLEVGGYLFIAAAQSEPNSAPLTISIGADVNNNRVFDDEEIAGSVELTPGIPITASTVDLLEGNQFSSLEDALTELSNNLLLPGVDYFVEIETQNIAIDSNYDIGFEFIPAGFGEITLDDESYCCNNPNEKYYFDELTGIIQAGQDGIVAGQEIGITVSEGVEADFQPVVFLLNEATDEVLATSTSTRLQDQELGIDARAASLNFTVQEGISYSLSIETALPGQTGEYLIAFTDDVSSLI